MGKNLFQAIPIKESYRCRGKPPRIQITKNLTNRPPNPAIKLYPPKNKIKNKYLTNKTLPYSAIKIKANMPEPYSVLNPETNSDSLSLKSNGERFLSAILEPNQRIDKGPNNKNKTTIFCLKPKCFILYPPIKKI